MIVPLLYFIRGEHNLDMLKWGIFVAGLFTVAQFSFWGNYLPRMYPLHLRGTGESFAANIGGRMIGTMAALVHGQADAPHAGPFDRAGGGVGGTFVYGLGSILSFFLPEPQTEAYRSDDP